MSGLPRMLVAFAAAAVILLAAFLWMAGGVQAARTFEMPADVVLPATEVADTSTLTVVSWNIAWAYGSGSDSQGIKPREEMAAGLKRVGDALKSLHPDIVLLQEVDFMSDRSYRADQAKVLAQAAGLPFAARAPSWKANYVPFPYWPPREQWGWMRSGGAILSRLPISRCRIELFEKPEGQFFLYRLFYLFRYLQRCEIQARDKHILVYNTHFEAFDTANRIRNARRAAEVRKAEATPLTIFGGDLNTTPPEAEQRRNFPDDPASEHGDDETIEAIRAVPGLSDVVPPDTYRAGEAAWFTFPSDRPNRKLDFIFAGGGFEVIDRRVAGEARDASDHLPIVTRLRIR